MPNSPMSELFASPEERRRYLQWVAQLGHPRTGIPEPTEQELAMVYAKPFRYPALNDVQRT
jgi:hypothetical protein